MDYNFRRIESSLLAPFYATKNSQFLLQVKYVCLEKHEQDYIKLPSPSIVLYAYK
jgi:hypothetical protein